MSPRWSTSITLVLKRSPGRRRLHRKLEVEADVRVQLEDEEPGDPNNDVVDIEPLAPSSLYRAVRRSRSLVCMATS